MKHNHKLVLSFLLIIIFIVFFGKVTFADFHNYKLKENSHQIDTLKSYLGLLIKEDNISRIAKTNDRIRVFNSFQVVIHPLEDYFLYLISNSGKKFELLTNSIVFKDSTYIFPSDDGHYISDGQSSQEVIIIVLLKQFDTAIEELLSKNDYLAIEKYLNNFKETSSLIKSQKTLEIMEISGNVRNIYPSRDLTLYLGKSCIIKKFFLDVKK